MRKLNTIKWWSVIVVLAALAIQFIPVVRNASNLPAGQKFERTEKVPANVAAILKVSCYDCHSDNTPHRWYSNIQPAAWFMARHIKNGKEELNFDKFNDYSNRRKKAKIKSIINQIEKDKMPLKSYRMMHPDSQLSVQDKKELLNFFNKLN